MSKYARFSFQVTSAEEQRTAETNCKGVIESLRDFLLIGNRLEISGMIFELVLQMLAVIYYYVSLT